MVSYFYMLKIIFIFFCSTILFLFDNKIYIFFRYYFRNIFVFKLFFFLHILKTLFCLFRYFNMCKYKKCFFFVPNFSLNFYDQIINTLHKQLFMYILIIWHIHNIITTKQEFDQKYVNY